MPQLFPPQTLIFSFVILLILLITLVTSDCGLPGHSYSAPLEWASLRQGDVYPEGHTVKYNCKGAIVSSYERKCKNGRWTPSIPRCPQQLDIRNLKTSFHKNKLIFRLPRPYTVVSYRIAFRRISNLTPWPEVGVSQESLLSKKTFSHRTKLRKLDTYDMRASEVSFLPEEIRFVKETQEITYETVNMELIDCKIADFTTITPSAPLCVDISRSKFYHFEETSESCLMPDTPLRSMVKLSFNSSGVLATFPCEVNFSRPHSDSQRSWSYCHRNADWSNYDISPCIKNGHRANLNLFLKILAICLTVAIFCILFTCISFHCAQKRTSKVTLKNLRPHLNPAFRMNILMDENVTRSVQEPEAGYDVTSDITGSAVLQGHQEPETRTPVELHYMVTDLRTLVHEAGHEDIRARVTRRGSPWLHYKLDIAESGMSRLADKKVS